MTTLGMNGAAEAGLSVLSTAIDRLQKVRQGDSYISYTKPARVEPITLVDADVLYSAILPDTMQTLLSVFTAYYLQAFSLSVNVGSINVVKHLDKLNPNRIGVDEMPISNTMFGKYVMESLNDSAIYQNALPDYSMESVSDRDVVDANDKKEKPLPVSSSIKDPTKVVTDASNLAVGKLVNVEISQGDQKASIPISIRLMTNILSSDALTHILTSASRKDTGFMERWHGWRSGRLEFVRDLILCQDLIDAHKKNLVNDKTGVYNHILERRSKNVLTSLISGDPSIGSASNICILSSTSVPKIEEAFMGQITKYQVRQKMFEDTYLMILAVVDQEWDRVTLYFRGIPESTTVGARDLKSSSKDGGTDIMAILNAFKEGKSLAL